MTPMTASAAAVRKSAQSKWSRGIPKKRALIATAPHGAPSARSARRISGVATGAASTASAAVGRAACRSRLRRARTSRPSARRGGGFACGLRVRREAVVLAHDLHRDRRGDVGPEPPCSTRTTTAISGAFAGEYAANHAWSRAKYQAFFGSSPPRVHVAGLRGAGLAGDVERRDRAPGYAVPFASLTTREERVVHAREVLRARPSPSGGRAAGNPARPSRRSSRPRARAAASTACRRWRARRTRARAGAASPSSRPGRSPC